MDTMARNPNDLSLKSYCMKDKRTITLSEHVCTMLDEQSQKEFRPARDIAEEILEAVLEGRWNIVKHQPIPKPMYKVMPSNMDNAVAPICYPLNVSVKTILSYYKLSIAQLCRRIHCRADSIQVILDRENQGLFSYARKKMHDELNTLWEGIPEDYRKKVWKVNP